MGPLSTHLSSITQFPSFRVWYVIFILKEKGLRERNRYPGEFYNFSDQELNERDCYGFRYVIYVCENHDSQDLGIYKALSLKFHFIYNMWYQSKVKTFMIFHYDLFAGIIYLGKFFFLNIFSNQTQQNRNHLNFPQMGHFGILEWMHLYFTMMSSNSSSEKLVTIRILDNMEKTDSHGMHSLGSI